MDSSFGLLDKKRLLKKTSGDIKKQYYCQVMIRNSCFFILNFASCFINYILYRDPGLIGLDSFPQEQKRTPPPARPVEHGQEITWMVKLCNRTDPQ